MKRGEKPCLVCDSRAATDGLDGLRGGDAREHGVQLLLEAEVPSRTQDDGLEDMSSIRSASSTTSVITLSKARYGWREASEEWKSAVSRFIRSSTLCDRGTRMGPSRGGNHDAGLLRNHVADLLLLEVTQRSRPHLRQPAHNQTAVDHLKHLHQLVAETVDRCVHRSKKHQPASPILGSEQR